MPHLRRPRARSGNTRGRFCEGGASLNNSSSPSSPKSRRAPAGAASAMTVRWAMLWWSQAATDGASAEPDVAERADLGFFVSWTPSRPATRDATCRPATL